MDQDQVTVVREDNKIFAVAARGSVFVKERIPLHVIDKWDEDKRTWYLTEVAKRLKKELNDVDEADRRRHKELQAERNKKLLGATDGETNGQQASGSEQVTSD